MSDENTGTAVAVRKPRALRARVQADTSKRGKFEKLANGRAAVAISAIERLGNLSSPAYEYSDEHVAKLETALRDATKKTIDKLRSRTARRVGQINLF